MIWLCVKIVVLICLAIFTRGVLPRYRIDQLVSLNWKFALFLLFIFFCEIMYIFYLSF